MLIIMSHMLYKKFTFLLIIIITAVSPFVYSQQANDSKSKGYYKMQMIQLQQTIEN